MDPLAASSTVNVKYKPEIVVMGLDIVYIVLGEDFVLNCSYTANPAVTAQVLWYKNGKMLDYKKVKMRNLTLDGSVIELTRGKASLALASSSRLSCNISASRESSGLYSCRVLNNIGSSPVIDVASVYVEDVPEVELSLEPLTPVSEPKKENVTLTCSSRTPDDSLTRVKWFLDGELLKELPECLK